LIWKRKGERAILKGVNLIYSSLNTAYAKLENRNEQPTG
jgi:hypothetical protein